ncbi:MAG: leucine-rich repeat domain-containing protein [Alloprevotella sp.]|nr:leucine-rich repeat domain-containing protein [Alloprevotella sp.]
MKKNLLNAWMLAAVLLAAFTFAACGGSDEPEVPEPPVDDVTGLTVLTEAEDGLYRSDVLLFRITDKSKHEVEVVNPVNPETCRGAEIPHAVNIGGERYAVTAIADKAFSFYDKKSNAYSENPVLEFLTIPHSVKRIGTGACFYCTALKSIFIPKEVTEMDNAFQACGLTEIVVQEGNPVFDSRQDCNAIIRTKDNCLLVGCQATVIPDGIKTIGTTAFHLCRGLTEIEIPASVAAINNRAFRMCSNLTKITSLNPTPPTVGDDVFSYINKACVVYVPAGSKDAYVSAWPFEYGAVKEIGSEAVNKVVTIDGLKYRVTSATEAELVGPEDLEKAVNVVVKEKVSVDGREYMVTSVGEFAFADYDITRCGAWMVNTNLHSVKLPATLKTISLYAFANCINLQQIDIPESVTEIGYGAFTDSGLTSVKVPGLITDLEESVFEYCENLEEVSLPENLKTIGSQTFCDCSKLKSITLPKSLQSVGRSAFNGCKELTEITSLNSTPPTLELFVFDKVPRSCTIYVPKGCKSKYVEAWGDKTDFMYDDYVEM